MGRRRRRAPKKGQNCKEISGYEVEPQACPMAANSDGPKFRQHCHDVIVDVSLHFKWRFSCGVCGPSWVLGERANICFFTHGYRDRN